MKWFKSKAGPIAIAGHPIISIEPLVGGMRVAKPLPDPPSGIQRLPVPPWLEIELGQVGAQQFAPLVKAGEWVEQYQAIAATAPMPLQLRQYIHAPLAGQIERVVDAVIHLRVNQTGSNQQSLSRRDFAILSTDQRWTMENFGQRLAEFGIRGLGGASFPTAQKRPQQNTLQLQHFRTPLLVVNGMECEPLLGADQAVLQHDTQTVIRGVQLWQQLTNARIVFGLKRSQQSTLVELIRLIDQQEQQSPPDHAWQVAWLDDRYPAGGERQLLQQLFNIQLKAQQRPSELGISVLNVQTLAAIACAHDYRQPMIERVVTLNGQALQLHQPVQTSSGAGHYRLYFGTPLRWLLTELGLASAQLDRLLIGGHLMGKIQADLTGSIQAGTTGVFTLGKNEQLRATADTTQACINCLACVPVCPEKLQPQQLWHVGGQQLQSNSSQPNSSQPNSYTSLQLDQLQSHAQLACIECGACELVCPSQLPLVQRFRESKTQLLEQQHQHKLAAQLELRYQGHQAREQQRQTAKARPVTSSLRNRSQRRTTSDPKTRLRSQLATAKRLQAQAQAALLAKQKAGADIQTLANDQNKIAQLVQQTIQAQTALDAETDTPERTVERGQTKS